MAWTRNNPRTVAAGRAAAAAGQSVERQTGRRFARRGLACEGGRGLPRPGRVELGLVLLLGVSLGAGGCGLESDDSHPCGGGGSFVTGADGGLVCGEPFAFNPTADPAPSPNPGPNGAGPRGRFAVKVVQYIHLNAAGIVETDTVGAAIGWAEFEPDPDPGDPQGALEGRMDLMMCHIEVPKIQIPGQPLPSTLELTPGALDRVAPPGTRYRLSGRATCESFQADPNVVLAGARLQTPLSDPLPWDPATQTCAGDADTGCIYDLEEDGHPGATFIASNFPALEVDEVYATLRSWVALDGLIVSPDLIVGEATFGLEVVVVGCSIRPLGGGDRRLCNEDELHVMASITPDFSPTPGIDSTFVAVRVSPDTDCAAVIQNADSIFGR